MTKLLIVFGTTEGQTAKIAGFIAEVAERRACAVDIFDARRLSKGLSLDGYDGVLVGASMHGGRYQRSVRDFVRSHRAELERMPAAFFSVSLTEAYPHPDQRAQLNAYLARFFDATGWHPRTVASFAGALAYTRYGFFKRLVMRTIARQVGAPTSTSRDYEFTDWQKVTQFAEEFVATLQARPAVATSG